MVSFEFFVKSMPPSLSELKVLPSFCLFFKIPDDVTVTIIYVYKNVYVEFIFYYLLTHLFGLHACLVLRVPW